MLGFFNFEAMEIRDAVNQEWKFGIIDLFMSWCMPLRTEIILKNFDHKLYF